MSSITDVLVDIKEQLLDAGLSLEDYNDVIDFLGEVEEEDD